MRKFYTNVLSKSIRGIFALALLGFFSCGKPPILINPENNPVESHLNSVIKVKYSSDGKLLASGGNDSNIIIWDGQSGRFLRRLDGRYDKIFDIAFVNSNNQVLTVNYQGTLLTWDVRRGIETTRALYSNFIPGFDVNSEKGILIVPGWDTALQVLSLADYTVLQNCKSADYKIRAVKYSVKTNSVYGVTAGGNLLRWDLADCSQGENFNRKIHDDAVTAIDIDDEANLLVSASVDSTVKLFSLDSLKEIAILKEHKSSVNAVKIVASMSKMVSADKDGKIIVWDIRTLQPITLAAFGDSINSIDVSPDGRFIATGGNDKTIKLWSMAKILSTK